MRAQRYYQTIHDRLIGYRLTGGSLGDQQNRVQPASEEEDTHNLILLSQLPCSGGETALNPLESEKESPGLKMWYLKKAHQGPVTCILLVNGNKPDQKFVITSSADNSLLVYDARSSELITALPFPH